LQDEEIDIKEKETEKREKDKKQKKSSFSCGMEIKYMLIDQIKKKQDDY
jgi:hypothetical protein